MTSPLADFDAVILAGGRARRLGGVHKPDLLVGGRPVLHRVADAVSAARRVIVVGPHGSAPERAVTVQEDPPGAGPVPALIAGLTHVRARWVAVLAADLPFLGAAEVAALRERAAAGAGAVALDAGGRDQWLVGVWRVEALRSAASTYEGSSLRGLLDPLQPARLALNVSRDMPPPWLDCDTSGDVENAREWARRETAQGSRRGSEATAQAHGRRTGGEDREQPE